MYNILTTLALKKFLSSVSKKNYYRIHLNSSLSDWNFRKNTLSYVLLYIITL